MKVIRSYLILFSLFIIFGININISNGNYEDSQEKFYGTDIFEKNIKINTFFQNRSEIKEKKSINKNIYKKKYQGYLTDTNFGYLMNWEPSFCMSEEDLHKKSIYSYETNIGNKNLECNYRLINQLKIKRFFFYLEFNSGKESKECLTKYKKYKLENFNYKKYLRTVTTTSNFLGFNTYYKSGKLDKDLRGFNNCFYKENLSRKEKITILWTKVILTHWAYNQNYNKLFYETDKVKKIYYKKRLDNQYSKYYVVPGNPKFIKDETYPDFSMISKSIKRTERLKIYKAFSNLNKIVTFYKKGKEIKEVLDKLKKIYKVGGKGALDIKDEEIFEYIKKVNKSQIEFELDGNVVSLAWNSLQVLNLINQATGILEMDLWIVLENDKIEGKYGSELSGINKKNDNKELKHLILVSMNILEKQYKFTPSEVDSYLGKMVVYLYQNK